MPRTNRDDPPAVRVYIICDESKYLIARNVPALGCGEELSKLFASSGEIVECKPMDAEDCEPFTDVYWIEFSQVSSARFAKRKLDDSVFLGNQLQPSHAPDFESLSDTQDKLESRRLEVLARVKYASKPQIAITKRKHEEPCRPHLNHVSSNQDYFLSASMNETVRLVRNKLDIVESTCINFILSAQMQSSNEQMACPRLKKAQKDDRRRILFS